MAARDGDISDEELRRQLKALGEDVGPVTDSTRSFLFRKLKRLRNQQGSSRLRKEKTPPRRRPSPARKSLPATTRSQSPSRKRFGFSSDEEDAGPSLSSTLRVSDRLRGTPTEPASSDGESLGRSEKTRPAPTRRGELRQRVPSFIEHSVPERTLDSTDGNNGDFSDQDGPVFLKPKTHSSGVSRYIRTTRPERDESERSETLRSSTTYGKYESVNAGSQLNTTLRERQTGAKDVKTSLFWSLTGKIVLVISVICIGILLYVALKKHSSEKGLLEQFVKLPVCKGDNQVQEYKDKPPGCVPLLNISEHYADSLYKKLIVKAGLFECEDPSVDSRNVSKEELRKEIREDNYTRPGDEQKLILNKTLELILKHPEWKLRLFKKNNEGVTSIENVTWIDTSVSAKPLLCRINEAVSRLAYLSFVIAFVIGGLVIAYFIVRQRWRREEEETRLMYQFVENIIDILREHHEASKTEKNLLPYLPIPHVRDMLIPPTDRQRLSKAWNRAVRFLSANESRIRVESQRIAGEDFEVWRWIQIVTPKPHNPKLSLSGNKHGKYWQGQAFENFQSAVNPPVISPTPCLKIRNMFDPDVETEDSWHVMIQDAILEKCIENGAGVVHIAVDKSSSEGCVYVKCDTHHSAGLAFRSLHGCWFDGRLVAVKYLTLKRYHQRFPVALEATERLSPSGSSPSSLVTFDPDEAGDGDVNDSDIEF